MSEGGAGKQRGGKGIVLDYLKSGTQEVGAFAEARKGMLASFADLSRRVRR